MRSIKTFSHKINVKHIETAKKQVTLSGMEVWATDGCETIGNVEQYFITPHHIVYEWTFVSTVLLELKHALSGPYKRTLFQQWLQNCSQQSSDGIELAFIQ